MRPSFEMIGRNDLYNLCTSIEFNETSENLKKQVKQLIKETETVIQEISKYLEELLHHN